MFIEMGEIRNAYKILVGNPEEKRLLGRPGCRWKKTTESDIIDTGWEGMDL
jgi:hypothetical protein